MTAIKCAQRFEAEEMIKGDCGWQVGPVKRVHNQSRRWSPPHKLSLQKDHGELRRIGGPKVPGRSWTGGPETLRGAKGRHDIAGGGSNATRIGTIGQR